MPLHDWKDRRGWDGVHLLWIAEILRWVKPRLPKGYRAFVGTAPTFVVDGSAGKPDMSVIDGDDMDLDPQPAWDDPDIEVAVATLEVDNSLYVEQSGRLVAAIELISPRNKDRASSKAACVARCAGYLQQGANLLLVDVHPRPTSFSLFEAISTELEIPGPDPSAPAAVCYRVGGPTGTGGSLVALWRRPFAVGAVLPVLPLPITVHHSVAVDLESTYSRAASDAYLD